MMQADGGALFVYLHDCRDESGGSILHAVSRSNGSASANPNNFP
ncbi:MAG: hypothetical protein ACREEM_02520 [Blastocatellia bacterium]